MDNYQRLDNTDVLIELQHRIDTKINAIYEIIHAIIKEHAHSGHSKIFIFIPRFDISKPSVLCNISIDNYYISFVDNNFQKKLIKKFKIDGIKMDITDSLEKYYVGKRYFCVRSGYIVKCKWNKNYAHKSCAIM